MKPSTMYSLNWKAPIGPIAARGSYLAPLVRRQCALSADSDSLGKPRALHQTSSPLYRARSRAYHLQTVLHRHKLHRLTAISACSSPNLYLGAYYQQSTSVTASPFPSGQRNVRHNDTDRLGELYINSPNLARFIFNVLLVWPRLHGPRHGQQPAATPRRKKSPEPSVHQPHNVAWCTTESTRWYR